MEMIGEQLDAFVRDFKKAVAGLQDQYEVTISLGRITYEEERFTTKMTVINGREKEDVARAAFDADVWKYKHLGLEQGMYHRIFVGANGKRYAIHGFNTRAHKYPLRFIDISDGSMHRAGEGFIDHFENGYYVDVEFTVE